MGLNEKHGRHGTYHVITAMAGTRRVANSYVLSRAERAEVGSARSGLSQKWANRDLSFKNLNNV